MKKDYLKGFALGAALTCAVVGFTFSASADRSIQINDNIAVRINDANFTPRDPNGQVVEVFTYNGTTYAPIRAICEAFNLNVQYDSANRTALITSQGANTNYITAQQAQQAALTHAGVSAPTGMECEREWDDGRAFYEIEFYSGGREYEYKVDALTGSVLSSSGSGGYDDDYYDDDYDDRYDDPYDDDYDDRYDDDDDDDRYDDDYDDRYDD